ncbi:restriction endonuclease subunit S [Crocosphaera sp.]|uniref:restriction endonuclease subunit S n=1 Tax=Crocosphaera sp. TaxID=2729996 RepID=UPI003F230C7A
MRLTIQRYEEYKDSGIEWLGKIPEHWEIQRIKEVGKIQYGLSQPPRYLEKGLPLVRATNIERGKLVEKGLVFVSPDDVPWERNPALKENDILVVRSGAYTADSAIIPRKYHGSIAGFDMILRPTRVNPKYLSYTLLSNYLFKDQLILSSFRAAQPHLNKEELGTALIALPSVSEQKTIAHYLDTKTTQIDRKIDLLTQKAQRYEELKRSLINETVTRGLNKSVPMKDSGIEWIGEIPEHWEIRRLKDLAEIKGGRDSKDVELEEGQYPIYGSGGIFGKASKYLYAKPSVLLGRKGTIDKPLFVTKPFWSVETMFYTEIKKNVEPKFFYYQCLTIKFGLYLYGSAVPSMSSSVLSRTLFSTPNRDEQEEIVTYLDTKTAQIDQIIQTINTQIEKLKELRKTLINDVVTGKIKVTPDH